MMTSSLRLSTSSSFFASVVLIAGSLAGLARAAEPTPAAPPATAQKNKVKVELAADVSAVAPGETIRLGVFLRPDPEWHVYWKFAGDTGLPTEVRWSGPDGVDFDALQWPVPERLPDKIGGRSFGYGNEVLLTSKVRVPDDVLEGAELPLEAKVDWLVCKENCIQGSARVGLVLPVRAGPVAERRSAHAAAFDAYAAKVPLTSAPAGVAPTLSVAGTPVAPGGDFTVTIALAGEHLAPRDPLVEAFFPATEGLEVSHVARRDAPAGGLTLELTGKAASEGKAAERLEGVVRVVHDGRPLDFDVHVDVPRKDGPPPIALAPEQAPALSAAPPAGASGGDPCADAGATDEAEGKLSSFALALLLAFVGGIILNAMPCVLPVLSLKLLGVVEQAQDTPKVIWRHGLVYTAGVLASFLAFAIVLATLKTSWAFQFQDPTFVAIFTAIVFAFGLSLFGVFELALPGAARLESTVATSHGYLSSFNYGIFAVLLGTPCTAPFLGPALAYAFTQPPFEMTILLLMVGLGLAFPFLLLARFPGWRRFMPKPGPWLLTFKKVMGFFLIGTAVFLLSIFAAQVSRGALIAYLVFLSVMSLALWIYGHWTTPLRETSTRWIATGIAVVVTAAGASMLVSVEPAPPAPGTKIIGGVAWHDFDQLDPADRAREGTPVFVDFTAEWCTTCKVNEATALHTDATRELFSKLGVLAVQGDFTVHKPRIAEWLERFNEPSVPLYVVIPPGRPDEAFKLGQLISESDVRDGLCRAVRGPRAASL